MSADVTDSKGYHHGDLKEALLAAAWEVIDGGGLDELTLRGLSRMVGVSHAAPYHHFKNREALVEVLRGLAFEQFTEAMEERGARSRKAETRLFEMGRAYIDFARDYPARMALMFSLRSRDALQDPRDDPREDPREDRGDEGERAICAIERRSFEVLVEAIVALQREGKAPKGDPSRLALLAFSAVHGFAKLWNEGPLSEMPSYGDAYERTRDQLLRTLIRGFVSERELADREAPKRSQKGSQKARKR